MVCFFVFLVGCFFLGFFFIYCFIVYIFVCFVLFCFCFVSLGVFDFATGALLILPFV